MPPAQVKCISVTGVDGEAPLERLVVGGHAGHLHDVERLDVFVQKLMLQPLAAIKLIEQPGGQGRDRDAPLVRCLGQGGDKRVG